MEPSAAFKGRQLAEGLRLGEAPERPSGPQPAGLALAGVGTLVL